MLVQIENLRTHPLVLATMTRSVSRLHAWVYEIENGNVMVFDDHTGQYLPAAEAGHIIPERTDHLPAIRQI